jgi:hypothetical protein
VIAPCFASSSAPLQLTARTPCTSTYKQRLLSLKSFVLVMFTRDSMVHPPKR